MSDSNANRSRGDLFLGEQKITRPVIGAALSKLLSPPSSSPLAEEAAHEQPLAPSSPPVSSAPPPERAQNLAVQPARAPLPADTPPAPAPIRPAAVRYVTAMPPPAAPEQPANTDADGHHSHGLHLPRHLDAAHLAEAAPGFSLSGGGLTVSMGGRRRAKSATAADASHYSNVAFWMGVIYLAVGIACLVVSVPDQDINCGRGGAPPLRDWVFGTGIAYTIIGGAFLITWILLKNSQLRPVYDLHSQPQFALSPTLYLLFLAGLFTLAWMIVGAVSLWRDGIDCSFENYRLWQMGLAAVILSIVLVVAALLAAGTAPRGEVVDIPHKELGQAVAL